MPPAQPSPPAAAPQGALTIPAFWQQHETSATRKQGRASYVIIPGGVESNGYLTLLEAEEGLRALGVFTALLQLMATFPPARRRQQAFLDSKGNPLNLNRVAALARLDSKDLEAAIDLLAPIGWLEIQSSPNPLPIPSQTIGEGSGDDREQPCRTEEKRREEKRSEERRGGEEAPHPSPALQKENPPEPNGHLHPETETLKNVQWINSLHPIWSDPAFSSDEFHEYKTQLANIRGLTELSRTKIAAYLRAKYRSDPNAWPNTRIKFLQNLPEIHTKALADSQTTRNQAGGRKGHTVDLDEFQKTLTDE